jgi:hypothetical protein
MACLIAFILGASVGAVIMGVIAGGTRTEQPKP